MARDNLPYPLPSLPGWVPEAAKNYLFHTEQGLSIRALARTTGQHASTILRQVRRYETLREDPLVDEGLRRLGETHLAHRKPPTKGETLMISQHETARAVMAHPSDAAPSEAQIASEGRRILRRLCETGAVLAVAQDMEKAVVVRDTPDGGSTRTAVVDRAIAEAMALKDWIASKQAGGRIVRYTITGAGRAALKRLLAEQENKAMGFADAQAAFAGQHRAWGEREVMEEAGKQPRRLRYNLAESPLTALARRKDKNGEAFLSDDLVAAGERLREDFELAQIGTRTTQNWEGFLTGGIKNGFAPSTPGAGGSDTARQRVQDALSDLGPGLADVVLRVCCFLEGMETAEKRMGWSARSGKIVLRIALQRLKRHFEEKHGKHGPMIG